MNAGEKPRQPQAGRPCPERLAFYGEIPRADDGVDASDQISTGSSPTPPARTGTRLSAELSRLSPITNRWSGGTMTSGMLSSDRRVDQFKDRVLASARQRLDETRGRRRALPSSVSDWPIPSGRMPTGVAVDRDRAVAQGDAIAGQADHALDPDLRAVAGPAEHHNIAALAAGRQGRAACPAGRGRRAARRRCSRREILSPAIRRRSAASAPSSRTAHKTVRRSRSLRQHDQRDDGDIDDALDPAAHEFSAHVNSLRQNYAVPPTVILSMRNVG